MWMQRLREMMGHRSKRENDTNDELQFHLEKEIEKNIAAGMSREEARRRALIAFGGVDQTREALREVHRGRFLDAVWQDMRYAWRILCKTPGFTVSIILTLALGIGLNTAIFSLIDAVLFRSVPAKNPEQLVLLRWQAHNRPKIHSQWGYGYCQKSSDNPGGCSFSLPWFKAVKQANVFSGLAGFAGFNRLSLSGNGPATMINNAQLVSGDFFETIGTKAAIGRTILPSDDTPDAAPVLMLSYGYWQRDFGGSASVVGRTVKLNGIPFTIVGVAEKGFEGLAAGSQAAIWLPFSVRARLTQRWTPDQEDAGAWWIAIVGRLRPELPLQKAQVAMDLLFRNETMHGEKPLFQAADEAQLELAPAQSGLDGGRQQALQPLWVLMMAVALVLLIACANIGGLLLARATARTREIAVRLTLGARRTRLISQLLVESLMLAVTGGALGLLVGQWGSRLLLFLTNDGNSALPFTPHLDGRVLAFTFGLSVLTAVLFGLAPILRSLRVDLTPALKSGSDALERRGQHRHWYSMGNLLVVAQVALAIVTLVSAGLLVRTLRNLKSVDLGFDPSNVLVFSLNPLSAGYKDSQLSGLYGELQEKFASLPGVQSVTYSWTSLLGSNEWDTDIHPPGTPEQTKGGTDYFPVGPGFFESLRLPLKVGRDFSSADFAIAQARAALPPGKEPDPKSAPLPTIVNETFVKRYFPNVNPLGQHVDETLPDTPGKSRGPGWVIVGVAGDAKYEGLRREIAPTMYVPWVGSAAFSIRASGDPMQLLPAIREIVNRRDSNLPIFRVATESEQIDRLVFVERRVAQLSSFFAILAVALACTGIYGLLSYEVTRRTREIGIRMAIGAQRTHVLGMIVRNGLVLAAVGVVVGTAASFATARLLQSLLYQVHGGDPLTLIAVASALLVVSLAACYIPGRRATRVDPLVALRYE
jgi:predicted permease